MNRLTRTFLVKELPSIEGCEVETWVTGYISFLPLVYIEKRGEDYLLLTEISNHEGTLTEQVFYQSLSQLQYRAIVKKKIFMPSNPTEAIYLNIYEEQLLGLVTAEVEFVSKEKLEAFVAPDWFGAEITNNINYRSQSLVTMTTEDMKELQMDDEKTWHERLVQISEILSNIESPEKKPKQK